MVVVKRYKDCSWNEKVWRQRHLLRVPIYSFKVWWYNRPEVSFWEAFHIELGFAEFKMEKYATWEELKKQMNSK